jgi:hypothetical protein
MKGTLQIVCNQIIKNSLQHDNIKDLVTGLFLVRIQI